jgi:hypothetical protein
MEVLRLGCPRCATVVEGRFADGLLSLDAEQRAFVRAFLLARGNLRELERRLGMSYQAVRARLDVVVEVLRTVKVVEPIPPAGPWSQEDPVSPGEEVASPEEEERQVDAILTALEAGDVTVREAHRRLQEVWRGEGARLPRRGTHGG